MKLPRVRFTVRRMMVAVALVALCLAAWSYWDRRDERFLEFAVKAMTHTTLARDYETGRPFGSLLERAPVNPRKAAYHAALARKYERAASHPWLPVAPDPPEPE
jgi:hypothetical protein